MIYAELKNIKTYKGVNKNLDKAIDFIAEKKYLNASFGKNIIIDIRMSIGRSLVKAPIKLSISLEILITFPLSSLRLT